MREATIATSIVPQLNVELTIITRRSEIKGSLLVDPNSSPLVAV